ncbi:MAG: DEAD/DEAH box helicase [Actinobacteria bacterium]|nr:DEAD/DEAH box helicase [Actinomycetota bacterium]
MSRPSRDQLIARYDFAIDKFQILALDALDRGESVLVAAPTGSGKTLVAEYAIEAARRQGQRAFYTAPIKALSNQKYNDLVAHYGKTDVGLLTGDNSVNPTAPIIVMTTEVLRNMIYARSDALAKLSVVVLDEVHFLQDAYRGPVWEEVIIHLDPTVQLVCLSATVSNATEVTEWLSTVRGKTVPIVEEKRPVELINHFVVGDAAEHEVKIFETIINGAPNQEVTKLEAASANRNIRSVGRGNRRSNRALSSRMRSRLFSPNRIEVVDLLQHEDLLPAIVFIFSRNQCDEAAEVCVRGGVRLTDAEQRAEIAEIVDSRVEMFSDDDLAALNFSRFANQLEAGIGSHHAGLVPAFKEIVEECFIKGLVRLVFATETLAVGLNMPARAVVIEKITKFTGEHHQPLKASEYTQLTGRAGRRGIDTVGHALVLWNQFINFDQVAALAMSRSFRLVSAFRPTYNMAANLIQTHSRQEAHHLLNLSFAQFQSGRDVVEIQARIARRGKERDRLREQAHSNFGDIDDYRRSFSLRPDASEIEEAIGQLSLGDMINLPRQSIKAAVVATAQRTNGTKLTLVTASKLIVNLQVGDFESPPQKIGFIKLPDSYARTSPKFIKEVAQRVQRTKVKTHNGRGFGSGERDHPVLNDPELKRRLIAAKSADRIDRELKLMEERIDKSVQSVSAQFDDLVRLMERRGYVSNWQLTDQGRSLARIFHELDLVIAEALIEKLFDDLNPAELASLLSVFVYEYRRAEEPPKPRIPKTLQTQWKVVKELSETIAKDEELAGIAPHRPVDAGLMEITYDWASGGELIDILDDDLTAGDFVRTMKQLIDLLRQISLIAANSQTSQTAEQAVTALFRGVVAASQGSTIESL